MNNSEFVKLIIDSFQGQKLDDLHEIGAWFASGDVNSVLNFNFSEKERYNFALFFYEKASSLGHGESSYDLAMMYLDGEGVEKNSETTKSLLRKALKQGYDEAQEILSSL